jgi:hypothetical protein
MKLASLDTEQLFRSTNSADNSNEVRIHCVIPLSIIAVTSSPTFPLSGVIDSLKDD